VQFTDFMTGYDTRDMLQKLGHLARNSSLTVPHALPVRRPKRDMMYDV